MPRGPSKDSYGFPTPQRVTMRSTLERPSQAAIPPVQCLLKLQGKSFECLDVSLPESQICAYCKDAPNRMKREQEERRLREIEEAEEERRLEEMGLAQLLDDVDFWKKFL